MADLAPLLLSPLALTDTPTLILDAAEHLFAERGIDHVSIREIVRASGQRNLSAAHYHFGSRDALVVAVLERRLAEIDADRHARLDTLVAEGRADDLHALTHACIAALCDRVEHAPWGARHVVVAGHAMLNPKWKYEAIVDAACFSALARLETMARALAPVMPNACYELRMRMLQDQMLHVVARWIHRHGTVTPANAQPYRYMVKHLTAFVTAGLAAPYG